jgi:hypothetical protein
VFHPLVFEEPWGAAVFPAALQAHDNVGAKYLPHRNPDVADVAGNSCVSPVMQIVGARDKNELGSCLLPHAT